MKALAGTVYWGSTEFLLLSSPAVRLAAAVAGVVNGTKCCHAVFVFGTNDEYSAVGRKTHLLSALRQFFWGPYRVFFVTEFRSFGIVWSTWRRRRVQPISTTPTKINSGENRFTV